ncbi:hypothetical protein WICMUC_000050 [Wickerhamomyces mucosus]|uniref:Uncharacterized protein n=1 Tax=Wickerhamomyces mucosus TaxID=1378264 RepID=A0A9P8Q0D4_9ASCO|nr:hypothetical protein WICMUC_000050 [Wickerhamomyces mucosus]
MKDPMSNPNANELEKNPMILNQVLKPKSKMEKITPDRIELVKTMTKNFKLFGTLHKKLKNRIIELFSITLFKSVMV